jgi:hypothetical protein
MLRPIVGGLVAVACLSIVAAADAQSSGAVAQSLFEEGVRLMRAKQYAEACPKLAESHKLEPAGGTVFNLALCLEQDGKLASAYVAFDEAVGRAKKDGNKQRADLAEKRMAALRPRLSRAVVSVTKPAGVSSLDVRFDGTPLREQAWGIVFFVDVGTHTVTAEAPGYKSFRGELRVEAAGQSYLMNVPALVPDPDAANAKASRTDNDAAPKNEVARDKHEEPAAVGKPPPSERGPLPWILVGTGAALVGTGAVTGVLAFSKHSDSDAECPAGRCTADGVKLEDQANTFAWISNVTIPLGVIAGAAGAYLFLRSPARVAPTASGFVVYGAF